MARQRSHGTGSLFKREGRGLWIAKWLDHSGKRQERSTRTTDKATAERILQNHVAGVALRRDGIIDPTKDRYSVEGRKPLAIHVADYIGHCELAGRAVRHVKQVVACLDHFQSETGATRLADMSADTLGRYLAALKASGLAPKTVNNARGTLCAFVA